MLYAGTELGVFVTTDGGESWHVLGSGLPTAPLVDLAVHGPTSTLVAVTHGLSTFSLDVTRVRSVSDSESDDE